jgi:hypothetical protein
MITWVAAFILGYLALGTVVALVIGRMITRADEEEEDIFS